MFGEDARGRSVRALIGVALTACLALTACSSDDDEPEEAEQSSSVFGVPGTEQDDEGAPSAETSRAPGTTTVPPGDALPAPGPGADGACGLVPQDEVAAALGVDIATETTGGGAEGRDAYRREFTSCMWMGPNALKLTVAHSSTDDFSNGVFACEELSHTGPTTPIEPVAGLDAPATWVFFSEMKTAGKLRLCVADNVVDIELDRGGLEMGDDLKDQAVAVADLYVAALTT